MRLRVKQAFKNGMIPVEVRLNGIIQSKVAMADEKKGEIITHDFDGFMEGMDSIPRIYLYGNVRIMLGDRF